MLAAISHSLIGLPPRVRGGLSLGRLLGLLERTTVACAGRTGPDPRTGSGGTDYPRVCGADEHDAAFRR